MNQRLLIILMLGFSSGLPLSLLSGTLQAWFTQSGSSLMTVGLLSMIGFPYSYRFLWAPLLDRYVFFSIGRRRSWILVTQILLFLGFNGIVWFSPNSAPSIIIGLAVILVFISATQDIAIDAHRTEYLRVEEHALGASFAILGYRCALLIAGGLSLVIAQYCGWVWTYRLISLLMLIGMLAVAFSTEPFRPEPGTYVKKDLLPSFILPAKALFSEPDIYILLIFVIFYKLGEAFTASTSGIVIPFLIQGIGFPLDVIGYVNKILGLSAAIVGSISAGILLLRWSLFRALLTFGLFQAVSNLLFVALAIVGKNLSLFCLAVVCENFASGMSAVALVALFMRIVDLRYTATQFSILTAFAFLPRTFSGPIAALGQSWLGWVGLYESVYLISLGFIPFLFMVYKSNYARELETLEISDVIDFNQSKQA